MKTKDIKPGRLYHARQGIVKVLDKAPRHPPAIRVEVMHGLAAGQILFLNAREFLGRVVKNG